MTEPLAKVDSAIEGLDHHETKPKVRKSSSAPGVMNLDELRDNGTPIQVAIETQRTGWRINSSSTTVEDKEVLKKMLTTPPVKRIDIEFPLGMTVTARNNKGVTIKDALDAMHKPNKKRADDELDKPYLEGFEWNGKRDGNTEEETKHEWTRLHVRLQSTPGIASSGGKKKNKKNKDGEA
ncbi:hypothetical protein BKA67DRAFT_665040 [Truncatella angustata]|uniref:DUF6699 domain-containing protein n=1 Tax=Truncatella angustata TaxID=152316 RepID=A0A9P8RKY4_9PEZI|nr:uncharacterized protein BKA67DRAFT_665040 [Truncatella angustata]KAH6645205.1 hypothetical protein BKA67DRAFT_665040 [Truncatella angustata]KAH8198274.1 hypothetical protein TruAng_007572 [Truncatella angustata]